MISWLDVEILQTKRCLLNRAEQIRFVGVRLKMISRNRDRSFLRGRESRPGTSF